MHPTRRLTSTPLRDEFLARVGKSQRRSPAAGEPFERVDGANIGKHTLRQINELVDVKMLVGTLEAIAGRAIHGGAQD